MKALFGPPMKEIDIELSPALEKELAALKEKLGLDSEVLGPIICTSDRARAEMIGVYESFLLEQEEHFAEQFVLAHGWNKHSGVRVSVEELEGTEYAYLYFTKEGLKDYVVDADFWSHPDHEEFATEDVWEVVERIEDYSEGEVDFEKWKEALR